jgi:cation/acetate symporter
MPHFVGALAARRSPAATRLAGAWAALFVMLVVITVPALAAYAKLDIYGALAAGTKLSDLPLWLETPSRAGLAHVHGTSVAMLEQVAAMPGIERAGLAAVADYLALLPIALEQHWIALAPETQQAVVAAARTLAAEPQTTSAWDLYVTGILPVAAAASGNEAAMLSQAALVIEPVGLLLALPMLSGAPHVVAIAMALAMLVVGGVMVASLTSSLTSLDFAAHHDEERANPSRGRIPFALFALGTAGGLAALHSGEIVPIAVSSLSLAAAALFPVLAVGLAWKRATAAGAVAAILVGAGVTLYYNVGVEAFPAAFYETWPGVSDAGEAAIEEFDRLKQAWSEATGADDKAAAAIALDDWARGTPTRPGLANWAGIDRAAGGVFGAPLGLLALVLVSLLTRRRASVQR